MWADPALVFLLTPLKRPAQPLVLGVVRERMAVAAEAHNVFLELCSEALVGQVVEYKTAAIAAPLARPSDLRHVGLTELRPACEALSTLVLQNVWTIGRRRGQVPKGDHVRAAVMGISLFRRDLADKELG